MKPGRIWLLSLVLASSLIAAFVNGSILIRRDLRELCAQADAVFIGTCIARQSYWNPEHTLIFTASTFRVGRYLKGDLGPMPVINEPGGTVDQTTIAAVGVPEFLPGEEVIVFVKRTELGRQSVFGAAQGKYSVVVDPKTGSKYVKGVVVSDGGASHASNASKADLGYDLSGPELSTVFVPFADFVKRVEKLVKGR